MKLKISSQEIAERKITRRWGEKRLAQIVDAIALRRLFFATAKGENIAEDNADALFMEEPRSKRRKTYPTDASGRPVLVVRPVGKPVLIDDGKTYTLDIAPIWCRAFTGYNRAGDLNLVTVDFADGSQQEFTPHGSTRSNRETIGAGCDPTLAEEAQFEIVHLLERTIGKEHKPCPIAKQLNQYLWERFSK